MYIYNKICAENTTYGNPRRLFIVRKIEEGKHYSTLVAIIEEGYSGKERLNELFPQAVELDSYDVPVKEYRRYKNLGKEAGVYYM